MSVMIHMVRCCSNNLSARKDIDAIREVGQRAEVARPNSAEWMAVAGHEFGQRRDRNGGKDGRNAWATVEDGCACHLLQSTMPARIHF